MLLKAPTALQKTEVIMSQEQDRCYDEQIRKEADYWGRFEREAIQYGIPWWCDLRRATRLSQSVCGWMYDPDIEEILRGHYKKKLIETAAANKGNSLDIGCGSGWLSLELARKGMDVDAYDVSEERLRIARYYLEDNPFKEGFGSVNYQVADINRFDLKENRYDSVVAWDTLHHVVEIERLLLEVNKSLKAGGVFIVYDHIGLDPKIGKITNLIKRVKGAAHKAEEVSPFEDVTGIEMIDAIKKYFEIAFITTQLCFVGRFANYLLSLPNSMKYRLLRLCRLIDDALIKTGIFKGEYVFVIAKKRGSV